MTLSEIAGTESAEPDWEELARAVRALAWRTRGGIGGLAGRMETRRRGAGLALAEVRRFEPGDEVRRLDPRATARTGQPHVRVFHAERDQPIWLALDESPSMRFGSTGVSKRRAAWDVAAMLGLAAAEHDDRVGGFAFGDPSAAGLIRPPTRGRPALMTLLTDLLVRADDRSPDLDAAAETVGPRFRGANSPSRSPSGAADRGPLEWLLRRHARGTVFLISDFLGPDWLSMGAAARVRGLLVRAIRVVDPLEEELPDAGLIRFREPSGRDRLVDTSDAGLRARYRARAKARDLECRRRAARLGVPMVRVTPGVSPLAALRRLLATTG
jgi:uncharacterized protein (DUF58 family)